MAIPDAPVAQFINGAIHPFYHDEDPVRREQREPVCRILEGVSTVCKYAALGVSAIGVASAVSFVATSTFAGIAAYYAAGAALGWFGSAIILNDIGTLFNNMSVIFRAALPFDSARLLLAQLTSGMVIGPLIRNYIQFG